MSLKSEIFEQPAVLDRLLRTQADPAREVARAIRSRGVDWVLIAARGTSAFPSWPWCRSERSSRMFWCS